MKRICFIQKMVCLLLIITISAISMLSIPSIAHAEEIDPYALNTKATDDERMLILMNEASEYHGILLEHFKCNNTVLDDNKGKNTYSGLYSYQYPEEFAGAYIGGLNYTALFRLVAEFLCAAFCCGFLYSKYFKGTAKSTLTKELARKMDSFSFQMMFTNGLWAIFMLNDVFLIGQLSGSETVLAEYKIAYVVPANLSILVSAIGIFVAPYFTKYEHSGNYDWIRRYFKVVLKITMLIMGMASIVCFLLAKPIILVMYGNAYLPAVPIMRVLLVASFFNNGIRASIANILSASLETYVSIYSHLKIII